MAIKRKIVCDVCGDEQEEAVPEQGWPGWGAVQGVALDGVANPNVCPECLASVMQFIEEKKHGMD